MTHLKFKTLEFKILVFLNLRYLIRKIISIND